MANILKGWILPVLGIALTVLGLVMNYVTNSYVLLMIGASTLIVEMLILLKERADRQNAKPIIRLKDFGFEIKTWTEWPPSVCAYVVVYNEPKEGSQNEVNAKGVFPTVIWIDEYGDVVDRNNGRWFIPDEDQQGAIPQLTVDLDANGLPRKLHFTFTISQNWMLQSLWRTDGNKTEAKLRSGSRYDISISFKDKTTSKAEFYFRIMPVPTEAWPHHSLRMERLDKKNGKVVDVKKYDLLDLHKVEKEQGLVK